jgi:PAS domain S-box-containing protein
VIGVSSNGGRGGRPIEEREPVEDVAASGDATERHRATDATYRELFDSIDHGGCIAEVIFDEAGAPSDLRFLAINRAFATLSGLRDVVGASARDLLPGHIGRWLPTLGDVARTGAPRRFTIAAASPERTYDVFSVRVGPPEQHRLAILFDDVTERTRVERELRESKHGFAKAEALTRAGHWTVDPATFTVRASDGLLQILRMSPGEVSVAAWENLIHPEDRREAMTLLYRAALEGTPWDLEHRLLFPDGSLAWVRTVGEAVPRGEGELPLLYGTTQDITDRKLTEEALRESSRRKSEFLAVLSHELRNPLAPIRNCLSILERATPGGEQAARALRIIDRQVSQLTRLVGDLLDVTRITRGTIELVRERFELNELARQTAEDHRSDFTAAGVTLEVVLAPTAVWVHGDRTRVAQIIGNLLQNAAKFTPPGGHTALAIATDAPAGRTTITVADSGRGLAPEILPRLFEAFTQADTTLDRSQGGLGLGLALVKGLVEMHGGTIAAASAGVGRGATFTVTLPSAGQQPGATPPDSVAVTAPRRVLIIEDNADAADTLRELLTLEGHVVTVAATGAEGLALARHSPPDVVLCDIGLPGMDGYAVARSLRSDAAFAGVALVALTGYARAEDVLKARAAGFDAHLAKPPTMEALTRVLATTPRTGD